MNCAALKIVWSEFISKLDGNIRLQTIVTIKKIIFKNLIMHLSDIYDNPFINMVPLYSVKTLQRLLFSEFCICSFPVELGAFKNFFCKISFSCFHLKQFKLLIDIEVLL